MLSMLAGMQIDVSDKQPANRGGRDGVRGGDRETVGVGELVREGGGRHENGDLTTALITRIRDI
jgi:hypothetical protein